MWNESNLSHMCSEGQQETLPAFSINFASLTSEILHNNHIGQIFVVLRAFYKQLARKSI